MNEILKTVCAVINHQADQNELHIPVAGLLGTECHPDTCCAQFVLQCIDETIEQESARPKAERLFDWSVLCQTRPAWIAHSHACGQHGMP